MNTKLNEDRGLEGDGLAFRDCLEVFISQCLFANCYSQRGCIYAESYTFLGALEIANCIFHRNTALTKGVIVIVDVTISCENCSIEGNRAISSESAFLVDRSEKGSSFFKRCAFIGNELLSGSQDAKASLIVIEKGTAYDFQNCCFVNNSEGGEIYVMDKCNITGLCNSVRVIDACDFTGLCDSFLDFLETNSCSPATDEVNCSNDCVRPEFTAWALEFRPVSKPTATSAVTYRIVTSRSETFTWSEELSVSLLSLVMSLKYRQSIDATLSDEHKGLSGGEIVGISLGSLLFLLVLIVVVWCVVKKRSLLRKKTTVRDDIPRPLSVEVIHYSAPAWGMQKRTDGEEKDIGDKVNEDGRLQDGEPGPVDLTGEDPEEFLEGEEEDVLEVVSESVLNWDEPCEVFDKIVYSSS
jgi:hypothetical protein